MLKEKRIIATVTNPLFHDKRMIRICRSLANQGALVSLWGVKKPDVPQPVPLNFSQKLLTVPFRKGFLFYASYNILLFFRLLFTRYDLAIAVDLDTLTAVSLACRIRRKPWVYDAHEYFTEVPELEGRHFVKSIWKIVALLIGKFNMTVSQSLAEVLSENYHQKFHVIRNVPEKMDRDTIDQRVLLPGGPVNLVYYGYLNKGRGLEYILQALTLLPEQFHLLLIGGGDLEDELKKNTGKLGLEDRVKFTGWVEPDEGRHYLEKGHIGLNLLDGRAVSYYYSLANKTFDYMQVGIPAIHMDFPEYQSLAKQFNCISLLSDLDPEAISRVVLDLVSDNQKYREMCLEALRGAENLCWENEEIRLTEYVDKVIVERGKINNSGIR